MIVKSSRLDKQAAQKGKECPGIFLNNENDRSNSRLNHVLFEKKQQT